MKTLGKLFFLGLLLTVFSCGEKSVVSFSTRHLRMDLNSAGMVTTIEELATGTNHLSENKESPFLSLMDTAIIHPNALSYDSVSKVLTLSYPSGSKARVQCQEKGDYLRFEVLSVEPRCNITKVVWGPYITSIVKTIGETVCVVQDDRFAFGMQSL